MYECNVCLSTPTWCQHLTHFHKNKRGGLLSILSLSTHTHIEYSTYSCCSWVLKVGESPYTGAIKIPVTAWCNQLPSPQTLTRTCVPLKINVPLENTLRGSFWSLFVCGGKMTDHWQSACAWVCVCVHVLSVHIHQTNTLPSSHFWLCFVCCAMREIVGFLQIVYGLLSVCRECVCRFFCEWHGGILNFFGCSNR